MSQLALFEGSHLPRTAAREALERGELGEAGVQLARRSTAPAEAADAARLERIASALRAPGDDAVTAVHAAFASALATGEPRGFLSNAEWFRLYAQRMAGTLAADPVRQFRGWRGAHFTLAAGDVEAARRAAASIVESLPPGPPWIEAAQLEFEIGGDASALGWIHAACLGSSVELDPDPPALEVCGVPALDAAPSLPALPGPVGELFHAVRELDEFEEFDDLPGPRTRWVAVLGEIDRVLGPMESRGEQAEGDGGQGPGGDPPREFLEALRAARRSRERDGARSAGRCSDRELRARRRMRRVSPALLERYLRSLDRSLF